MEVKLPKSPPQDFRFQSASTSPYVTAPSSPKPFGDPSDYYFYASAPSSPSRAADIYAHFIDWEDKSSGRWPKPGGDDAELEFDFDFGFDRQLQRKGPSSTNLAAADELFEKGKFRPSKPPRHLHRPIEDNRSSAPKPPPRQEVIEERVKERGRSSSAHSRSRREPRSLSPIGGVEDSPRSVASTTTSLTKSGGSKRWRLKDLFLFRSASEGRVTGRGSKDPLRKYTKVPPLGSLLPYLSNKRGSGGKDVKNSSSKPADKNGSIRRGSGPAVSAHEMHYTMNRAASEELKKRTPLPFHHNGLFGCLSYNPAIHSITREFSSTSISRGRDPKN